MENGPQSPGPPLSDAASVSPPTRPTQAHYVPASTQPTNGLAVASLVLGILWLFWVGSLLAVIFGHIAVKQVNSSGGTQGGKGLAIAGLVLGWTGIGMFAVFFVLPLLLAVLAAVAST